MNNHYFSFTLTSKTYNADSIMKDLPRTAENCYREAQQAIFYTDAILHLTELVGHSENLGNPTVFAQHLENISDLLNRLQNCALESLDDFHKDWKKLQTDKEDLSSQLNELTEALKAVTDKTKSKNK